MPTISKFFGIKICLYANEHGVPHFHAKYEDSEAVFAISPLRLIQGDIGNRAFGMVMEWAASHTAELQAAWDTLQSGGVPEKINPLEN